jgi:glycosyltransferase involved in cell wall biosynthesis
MKLSFVTPRYGEEIVGGAEHAVMMLAENCALYGNVEVDILTTVAGDERTWTPQYKAGTTNVHNINVHRFANEPIDRHAFDDWARSLLEQPQRVTSSQFDQWLIRQGPYSPDLLDAIENCESDALVFHPMLSSPTSHGVFRARKPVVLHPALHDEPLSYMPGYADVLHRADLLAFSMRSEQNLARRLYGGLSNRQSVIGFGIDVPPGMATDANTREKYGIGDCNYAIVIGRVDPGKGADLCFEFFREMKKHIKGIDMLVFVGPQSSSTSVVASNDVILTGAVSEDDKWALLRSARCLISPSVTESFSLVVLEAMKCGVPVVVNGLCGPTCEHIDRSAGATFTNIAEFVAAVSLCSQDSVMRDEIITIAKEYVDTYYSWETLIPRYLQAVETELSLFTS